MKTAPSEGILHPQLKSWVDEIQELTNPDHVHWCDGSEVEWVSMTDQLVESGTFIQLAKKPNSFWCASDPSDVARVEDRTCICSTNEEDSGPTNN
jgi:phosphoenolpyruvate carboxykinase (GTP)